MKIEKELSEIAWNVDEPTYRADPALSYSTLAKYEREGFDNLDKLFEHISTPSLTLGSMVDCMITGTQEEFDAQFYVADIPSVGDKEKQVVEYLFRNCKEQYDNMNRIPSTYILEAANQFEFQKNWREDTRVRVLTERGNQYYQTLYCANNKTVVALETFHAAQAMARELKDSPATCDYFAQNQEDSPVRRYYQLKFKATFDGVDYRCMMDEVIINYEKKIIIPIDLKTSHKKEWNFEKSFLEWMYPIQARLYAAILKQNLEKDAYFKDFEVQNYRFIVVNRESLTPLVWVFPHTFTEKDLINDEGKVFRHPFQIGKELRHYLDSRPQVPYNINENGLNVITCLRPVE